MKSGSRVAVGTGLLLLGAGLLRGSFRRRLAGLLVGEEATAPDDIVAFAPHPSGEGGWSLDRRGNIFAVGNAPEFREVPQPVPWREASFVAIASTPTGRGVWTLDEKGNIFAFGDAPEFREIPEPDPWRRGTFASIASTPSGRGVWIVDRRGRILSFGDAAEFRLPRTDRGRM
jgi:hypothetical protein